MLRRGNCFAAPRPGENFGGGFLGTKIGKTMVQAVVGQTATLRMEKIVTLSQRGDERGKAVDVHVAGSGKLFHPPIETGGLIDRQRLVGPERGQHFRRMALGRERAVMFQAVHRIVRGANDLDLEFLQYALRGQFGGGQFFVRLFPDFAGGFFVEQIGDAEITLQFQMRPVIERVAERVRHGGRPGLELVKWTGAARAKTFRDAVGPHGAPFVVIAFEPDFKQILELAVRRDVARRNVAMVVKNRLGLGVLMVKFAGRFGAQQKIFVDEGHKIFLIRSSSSGFMCRSNRFPVTFLAITASCFLSALRYVRLSSRRF